MIMPNTLSNGEERHEKFKDSRGRRLVQYDYRSEDGVLFSTVKKTLEECIKARKEWNERRKNEVQGKN